VDKTITDVCELVPEHKENTDLSIIQKCVRISQLRDHVSYALTTKDQFKKQTKLENLIKTYPENELLKYLFITRSFGSLQKENVDTYLDFIKQTPGVADRCFHRLKRFANMCVLDQDYELAEKTMYIILKYSNDTFNRFSAQQVLDQIHFEKKLVEEQ
jgi:hypothetical protein